MNEWQRCAPRVGAWCTALGKPQHGPRSRRRKGEIMEVIGEGEHAIFRVRRKWDSAHLESVKASQIRKAWKIA